MGAKGKADRAAAAARSAKNNPYLQRLVADPELRDNMIVAYEAARTAYSRLHNGKAPTKALIEDKKLHKDLRRSAEALREATSALREAPKAGRKPPARRKGGFGKLLLVAILGGVIAMAVSEGLRNKILDALFGAEEEFDYTSTAAPAPAEEAPVA